MSSEIPPERVKKTALIEAGKEQAEVPLSAAREAVAALIKEIGVERIATAVGLDVAIVEAVFGGLTESIPIAGNLLRSYRAATEFQRVWDRLDEIQQALASDQRRLLKNIQTLRAEFELLAGQLDNEEFERIVADESLANDLYREINATVERLRWVEDDDYVKGYSKYLLGVLFSQPGVERAEALTFRRRYEELEPHHLTIIHALDLAQAQTTRWVEQSGRPEPGDYVNKTIPGTIWGFDVAIELGTALGRPVPKLELQAIAELMEGADIALVRAWMNDLEGHGLVNHVRHGDMGSAGPERWAADPLLPRFVRFVFSAESTGHPATPS